MENPSEIIRVDVTEPIEIGENFIPDDLIQENRNIYEISYLIDNNYMPRDFNPVINIPPSLTTSDLSDWGVSTYEVSPESESESQRNQVFIPFEMFFTRGPRDIPLEDMDFPEGFFDPVKVVLSESEFDALPLRTMSKKLKEELNISDTTCPICQEEINPRCHCTVLKCGHYFHKNCAKEWLTKQCEKPTCPMCRKDVREHLI